MDVAERCDCVGYGVRDMWAMNPAVEDGVGRCMLLKLVGSLARLCDLAGYVVGEHLFYGGLFVVVDL